MSNSNIRLYQVTVDGEPEKQLNIKGLAVKEKEFVIGDVRGSKEWNDHIATLDNTDPRKKLDFQAEQQITEQDVIDAFGDLTDDTINIFDAVKGVYLSEVPTV